MRMASEGLRYPSNGMCEEVCRARLAPKSQTRRLQRRTSSHLCSPYSGPIAWYLDSTAECRTPFREPPRFIVIAVMSVMSGTFPHTYGLFCLTSNYWRVRGPSRHRHDERHEEATFT